MSSDFFIRCVKKRHKQDSVEEEYIFSRFEDFLVWLDEFKGSVKIDTGVLLYSLAKNGRAGLSNRKETIDAEFGYKHYFQAREIAIQTGLIVGRWGGDVYARTYEASLKFAQAMDTKFVVESL